MYLTLTVGRDAMRLPWGDDFHSSSDLTIAMGMPAREAAASRYGETSLVSFFTIIKSI
jgi:hypothetical protein